MALVMGLTLLFGAWLLALARERPRPGPALLAMAVAGAAIATLAKGPVALVLPALVVGALIAVRRDLSLLGRLGVIPALALGGAIAALWYGAAFARHGREFFDIVARENWLRYVDSEDAGTGHSHGLVYLPLVGLIGILPWTPLLPLAGGARRSAATTFAALWVVITLLFFSLADAKRSVYLLPLFPALMLLVALGIERPPVGSARGRAARDDRALPTGVRAARPRGGRPRLGRRRGRPRAAMAQATRRAEHAGDRVGRARGSAGTARPRRDRPGLCVPDRAGAARRRLVAAGARRGGAHGRLDGGDRNLGAAAAR